VESIRQRRRQHLFSIVSPKLCRNCADDQRLKDWSLQRYGGYVKGGTNLVPPLSVGSFLRIPTSVVRVWTTN